MVEIEIQSKAVNGSQGKADCSDYTKWRGQIFDDMTPEEFDAAIRDFAESRNKEQILDRSEPISIFQRRALRSECIHNVNPYICRTLRPLHHLQCQF